VTHRTSSFVVERYLPGATVHQLHDIVDRLTRAIIDPPTHYRGSIIVPGDESCLCLFDAVDADAVRRVNDALGLPVARITSAEIFVGSGREPTPTLDVCVEVSVDLPT
jgi:hypothetical protein